MKYSGQIQINKPQTKVAEQFLYPENNKAYQDGFLRKELVSGLQGQAGAVSKMYYQFGSRELELTETIHANRLPLSFEAFYHHPHMDNTMKCRFIRLDENSCRYEYEFEYTRVSWLMPKLMFLLFPGMFRKQIEKWIRQFKEFAENQ